MRVQSACALVVMLVLAGCSAHSPFIAKGTTDTVPVSQEKYAPHNNPVFVTAAGLPPTAKYEVVAQIEVGKVWYGSDKRVLQILAERGRQLGADAVIETKTWHQPSGWSWASPHGSGKAIKITEKTASTSRRWKGRGTRGVVVLGARGILGAPDAWGSAYSFGSSDRDLPKNMGIVVGDFVLTNTGRK